MTTYLRVKLLKNSMKEIDELIEAINETLKKCPWVREQTIDSLKGEPLSEAKEVKEAIEKKDFDNFEEEIGDLIYDSLLILAIAERDGITTHQKVLKRVLDKLKRRKPWVFGSEKVSSAEEAVRRWHEIKKEEKTHK